MWLIIALCCLVAAIYTGIAFVYSKWPFGKQSPSSSSTAEGEYNQQGSSAAAIVFTVVLMAAFLGLSYMSMKVSIQRYEFAGRALAMGRPELGFAAMAPEIAGGIDRAFRGNNIR